MGIEKLPSGNFLEWRDGLTSVQPYWELRLAPDASISEGAAVEELDSLLRSAVRDQLISDVPLGILGQSGGVDLDASALCLGVELPPSQDFLDRLRIEILR